MSQEIPGQDKEQSTETELNSEIDIIQVWTPLDDYCDGLCLECDGGCTE